MQTTVEAGSSSSYWHATLREVTTRHESGVRTHHGSACTPGVMPRPGVEIRPILTGVDDLRPPICPACGVTMVPAELSELTADGRDWVCLECEETGEDRPAVTFAGHGSVGFDRGRRW